MAALTFDDLAPAPKKSNALTFDDLIDAPAADKGFFERVGDRYDEREQMVQDSFEAYKRGEQTKGEYEFQRVGKGAVGMVNDTVGEGFKSLGSGISSITPDAIKRPVAEAADYVADSFIGDSAASLARAAAERYARFAKENPRTARNIEATANIGGLAGALTPIKGTSAVSATMGAAGKGAKLVGKGAAKATAPIGRALLPSIDEGLAETAALAQKYKIPLSLDQVAGSRALKNVQKVSQELPFSGQGAFRDKQMLSFNRALFKTVGVEADRFTPKNMEIAFGKVGGEFDALTRGKKFPIGEKMANDLTASVEEIGSIYGNEAAQVFQREALKVINDFSGDAIPGEKIAFHRSRINRLARKATDNNKLALQDLESILVDGITSGDPAIDAALNQAKQRYKNLIVLEPLAAKAKGGKISPSQLNNRVSQVYRRAHTTGQSGEIGELARIGNELLPELGGSDTAQKLLYAAPGYGLASGAGLSAPVLTAATLGANRALQAGINRNQSLINSAVMKEIMKLPPKEARAALQKAGR